MRDAATLAPSAPVPGEDGDRSANARSTAMTSDEQKQARDAGARFPVDNFNLMMTTAKQLREVSELLARDYYVWSTKLVDDADRLETIAKRIYPGCSRG